MLARYTAYTIYEINMQSKQSITIQNISIAKLSTDIIANAANSGSQERGGV